MLILGCGYIGKRVARHYVEQGERVLAIVRSLESASALEQAGIPALAQNIQTGSLADVPLEGERVFHFAPPPGQDDEDPLTRHLISAFAQQGHPRRLLYISTTGVYGDCDGAWVDENRPPCPAVDRARRRWDAEQALRCWSTDSAGELLILRVAGIYGPGRLPIERIRRGLPLVREEESPYSNRIHAEDLIRICVAAMDRGPADALYNVCDGNPSTMTDYFFRVAAHAGLPRPPTISLEEAEGRLSPGIMSYMRESRRLSNRKLLEELGLVLQYPTLESVLRDCPSTLAGN